MDEGLRLHSGYDRERVKLESFFRFTEAVFGMDAFRPWHAAGGWTQAYRAADGGRSSDSGRILSEPIREIVFHFTPEKIDVPVSAEPLGDDSPLDVRGDFPLEGSAFKFPSLAQT